ncbi:hypothetical protein CEXT_101201 [Caerostris extrusa]|uniref:Uncharacterized protein n=1 Tax=Caerostris extrusa TaxID=172846 RepID=A0AAV4U222_CAEEX|nr:hypothetical protein CEXT_101201 [Caerostris extrusa]
MFLRQPNKTFKPSWGCCAIEEEGGGEAHYEGEGKIREKTHCFQKHGRGQWAKNLVKVSPSSNKKWNKSCPFCKLFTAQEAPRFLSSVPPLFATKTPGPPKNKRSQLPEVKLVNWLE